MIRTYTVYMHLFPNGKYYFGITKMSVDQRWQNGRGYNNQILMKNAIEKYGWNNIIHTILIDGLSKDDAIKIEEFVIMEFKSNNRKYGYNITSGGESLGMHSLESRLKMSLHQKGKKRSVETRKKISDGLKGRPVSDETRRKISAGHIGKSSPREPDCKKPVCQYSLYDGRLVNSFPSINDACAATGISKRHISDSAKGNRRSAGGFTWLFELDIINGADVDSILKSRKYNSLFRPVEMFDGNNCVVMQFPHIKAASIYFGVNEHVIPIYIEKMTTVNDNMTLRYA